MVVMIAALRALWTLLRCWPAPAAAEAVEDAMRQQQRVTRGPHSRKVRPRIAHRDPEAVAFAIWGEPEQVAEILAEVCA